MHPTRRMLAHALQDIDQVIVRIDLVQPAGHDQTLHDAHMLRAELRPAEHGGLKVEVQNPTSCKVERKWELTTRT